MIRHDLDEEDLRAEIYNLRKHISRVCGENNTLKVKIRKLHDEMYKRDKQLDLFLDPRRFLNISKTLQDKGASVLLNLKLKNDKLEQLLLEKDLTIKRLQNTLATAKLYNASSVMANKKLAIKKTDALLGSNKLSLQSPHYVPTEEDSTDRIIETEIVENNLESGYFETRRNSAESQIYLDFNVDLKQKIRNSGGDYNSPDRAINHSFEKQTKSEGTIIQREINQPQTYQSTAACEPMGQVKTDEGNFEEENVFNPAFQKILQTVENLLSRGPVTMEKAISVNQCIQHPNNDVLPQIQSNTTTTNVNKIEMENNTKEKIEKNNKIYQTSETLTNVNVCEVGTTISTTETSVDPQPHEEIKQLHVYLMDMIFQVDNLKDTISQMKTEQEKTETSLKYKDENIEKLASEIEELKGRTNGIIVSSIKYTSSLESLHQDVKSIEPSNKIKALNDSKITITEIKQNGNIRKKPPQTHVRGRKIEREKVERVQRKSRTSDRVNKQFKKENDLVDKIPYFRNNFSNISYFQTNNRPLSVKSEIIPLENEID